MLAKKENHHHPHSWFQISRTGEKYKLAWEQWHLVVMTMTFEIKCVVNEKEQRVESSKKVETTVVIHLSLQFFLRTYSSLWLLIIKTEHRASKILIIMYIHSLEQRYTNNCRKRQTNENYYLKKAHHRHQQLSSYPSSLKNT